MLKEKVLKALNKHLNAEFYSSYLYLSMAAHFESASLTGFASWMRVQSKEEYDHAIKIFDFIHDRDGAVELIKIDAPKTAWKTPIELFEEVYAHEKEVSKSIYELVDLGIVEKDHATTSFLQWFVNEQVEEESSAMKVLDRMKLVGDSKQGLFLMDREMGQRAAMAK
jgi:ferritin